MNTRVNKWSPRPDIKGNLVDVSKIGNISKTLSKAEMAWHSTFLCKMVILILMLCAWQGYATYLDNDLIFPTFTATIVSIYKLALSGDLFVKSGYTLKVLAIGYMAGLALATLVTVLATFNRVAQYLMELLTSFMSRLPAVALLPLAMIWFGLGNGSLIFVLVNSVLWPMALSTHSGFKSVPTTLRAVGKNYSLTGYSYARLILFPAAFASILTGAKIAWSFAWRTLIASELVSGVASGKGGLGWLINEAKNNLDIPLVFGGLLTIVIIGLVVENFVFKPIENCTVKKWGMQH